MRNRSRPLVALLSGLACFAGLQLTLALLMELVDPVLRDPELGYKTARLLRLQTEGRGQPLVVVLGSSRSALGFRPAVLEGRPSVYDVRPVVFNHGINGAGPLLELICLHRLLREGIRPDWLVVEIHPALLCQDHTHREEDRIDPQRFGWHELTVLRRYSRQGALHLRRWVRSRLTPAWSHRFWILSQYAPGWLPPAETSFAQWRKLERFGWKPHDRQWVTSEERRKAADVARRDYFSRLADFHISDEVDRILNDLLALCRTEGIRPVLVTMPEGSEFQSWYSTEAVQSVQAYLSGLSQENQVPWVDARSWMADEDFHDSHHLRECAAARFTERFGRVLEQMLADRLP